MATTDRDSNMPKLLEEDSNLVFLSSNGFKYLKDIEEERSSFTIGLSTQPDNSVDDLALPPPPVETTVVAKQPAKGKKQHTQVEDIEEDKAKMQEIFGTLKINNDITFGLSPLEFEAAIESSENIKYRTMRLRCHASYVHACAHAAFFVAMANKFKRNADDIRKNEIKKRNTRLLNENQQQPGMKIGVIGAGRLGRQLAHALLEFAEVSPNEIRVSTRQPEILSDLKEKGVDCYFDNRHIAKTVNILFLCVLPHQLQSVVDEIKSILPKKCIIYSLVRTIPATRLKNLLKPDDDVFIFKPDYSFNPNQSEAFMKWNFSLDIIESINKYEMMSLTNPLYSQSETIIQSSEYLLSSMIYTLLNICIFLKFNKSQTINSIKTFLFPTDKAIKFDEGLFIEPNENENFAPINLVEACTGPTRFSARFCKSKGLQSLFSRNYVDYFDGITKWKNAYKPSA